MSKQTFQTQCSHCHNIAEFHLGHNSTEDSIDQAIEHLHGKTQIQVRSIIKNHQINKAEYGFALYACPKCQTLYNPFAVTIEYDGMMLFQPFYKCNQCNSTLTKTSESIESFSCKHCGEKQLTLMK